MARTLQCIKFVTLMCSPFPKTNKVYLLSYIRHSWYNKKQINFEAKFEFFGEVNGA